MKTSVKYWCFAALLIVISSCGSNSKKDSLSEVHVITIEDATVADLMNEEKVVVVVNNDAEEGAIEKALNQDEQAIKLENATESDLMDKDKTIIVNAKDGVVK